MLLNCSVGEHSESSLDCKKIQPVHPKGNQCWIFFGRTVAEAEAPILWPPDGERWLSGKDPDAGKDWRQEKGTTGWDGWMASPTLWTWVWVDPGSWWWTRRPGMLWFMGSQRVGHNWMTELNWTSFPAQFFCKFLCTIPKTLNHKRPAALSIRDPWEAPNILFTFLSE